MRVRTLPDKEEAALSDGFRDRWRCLDDSPLYLSFLAWPGGTLPVAFLAWPGGTLPFGPPYKPIVSCSGASSKDRVYLSMSLVGSGGERCTSLSVNGSRPPSPELTISTREGKVIERGKLKFG